MDSDCDSDVDYDYDTPVLMQQQPASSRRITARTPAYLGSRLPVAQSNAAQKPDTVTYHYDIAVPVKTLFAQPDGGKTLTIGKKSGISRVTYSNPYHTTPEAMAEGDVDILNGTVSITQSNTIGAALHVATSIPVPEVLGTQIGATPAHAPFGFLGLIVDDKGTATVDRHLTPDALAFVDAHPGQTAAHQDDFVYAAVKNPDMAHIYVNPPCATLAWYNKTPEIVASGRQVYPKDGDALGLAYADKTIAMKAKADCQAAMRAEISHCNVTNPDKFQFTLSAPPVNTLVGPDSVEAKQPSLRDIIEEQACLAKNPAMTSAQKVSFLADFAKSNVSVRFMGAATFAYNKSCSNFKMQ